MLGFENLGEAEELRLRNGKLGFGELGLRYKLGIEKLRIASS